jgi:hypothetical protein
MVVQKADTSRQPALAPFPPQEYVGDRVEMWGNREVLINSLDPVSSCFVWRREPHRLSTEHDLAAFQRQHACQHVDQCRLAGAIVADQRDDLAGEHRQIYVPERLNRPEVLVDSPRFQHRLPHRLRAHRHSPLRHD